MKEWMVLRARLIRLVCTAGGGIAAIGAASLLGVAIAPGLVQPVASQPAAPPAPAPGTFKPTEAQWQGLKIATVELVTFRSERVTEGNIAIDDDLNTPVFSPYSGRIVKLIARLGDHVERGAPLFEVATEFVNAANSLITPARNQLDTPRKSEADIAALEAPATQQFDLVATVSAPIEGIVTQRQTARSEDIQSIFNGAGDPIYTIGDLSTVWLNATVCESDAPLLHTGAPVEVRVAAYPDRVFNARISWVAASLDPNTHRLPVRADVENPDRSLKPTMPANLTIVTGDGANAPAVPKSAIVYDGDTARVWVALNDGTLEIRPVRFGRVQAGMVEILDGVSVGDKMVTSGVLFVKRAASND